MRFAQYNFIRKVASVFIGKAIVFVFFIFLAGLVLPQAVYATMYAPGATLEPDCAPGSSNCGVVPLAVSGANSNITSLSGLTTALSAIQGGTGLAVYQAGDILYAGSTSTLSKLSIGATGKVLKIVGGVPAWGDDNGGTLFTASEQGLHLDTGTNVFSIALDGTTLSDSASGLKISTGYTGQSSINTVGTITNGTWHGTALGVAYGGTGLGTTPNNGELLVGNGTGYALANLTGADGVTITNSTGTVTVGLSITSAPTITTVANNDFLPIYTNGDETRKKITYNDLFSGVLGALTFQGTWNASTNSPVLANGDCVTSTKGKYYVVGTSGTTTLGGVSSWGAGDWVVCNGTVWQQTLNTNVIASVFGRTGTVTAQSGDYTGSQITNTPAGNLVAVTAQGAINELDTEKEAAISAGTTGQYWRGDKSWQALDTSAVAENGSALYFTNTRARQAVSNSVTGLTYTSSSGIFTITGGYSIPLTASTTEWNTSYNRSVSSWTGPLQFSGGTASITLADATHAGYLSATDWNTFNGKVSTDTNIGNANLTLSGARTLALNGNSLTIDGTTGDVVFSDNGNVSIGGGLSITSTSTLSGDFATPKGADHPTAGLQHNVNLGTGSLFRYTGTNVATFTGIAGGTDGRIIRIMNASAFDLTIADQNGSSLFANQVITATGFSSIVRPDVMITLQYDSIASHWRIVSQPVTDLSLTALVTGGNAFGAVASLGTTDAFALNFITSGNTRFSVATTTATLTGSGATAITTNSTLALSSAAGSAFTVTAGTSGSLTLDTGTTGDINVGTGLNAKTLTIGNTSGGTSLNLKSGTGGINLTGLLTFGNASATVLSVFNGISVGTTATSTISGNNGLSILRSDLSVTGSSTLQNLTVANATATGSFHAATLTGDAQNVTLARIGNSSFSTLQDLQNVFHSSGWVSGGDVTDAGGGAVSVTAGTGLIRSTNSATSTISYFDWVASTTISIPTGTIGYVGVEYNGGSPRVISRTSEDWNYKTDFPLARVSNELGVNHVMSDVQGVGDHAANMIRREFETMPLARDERDGGLVLSESANGNRNISVSAGALWDRLNRFPILAFNSSGTDTFEPYLEGVELHPEVSTWDNMHYDNGNVLTTLTDNYYAVLWFHLLTDGSVVMTYGLNEYPTLAAATAEEEPMDILANDIVAGGRLIGRLIFKKGATTAAEVDSSFTANPFSATALTHLSNLTGLDYQSSGLTGFVASAGVSGSQTIIGGTNPVDGLSLQSTSATGTTDFIKFLVGTNGTREAARISDNGNFGVGTSTPYAKFSVSGQAVANNFVAYSSTGTSSFAGPVSLSNTLTVSGLSTLGSLTLTGLTTLQDVTAINSTTTNATTTNLQVSGNSKLGTITVGTWNGSAIGPTFGGTGQTSWTTGDVLYASAADTLSRLPIGSAGTVLTVGGSGVPTWAASGAGGGGVSSWATTTNNLATYPAIPTMIVLVGASATSSLGASLSAIFEVTGNSLFSGTEKVTGLATLSGGVSTTNASMSGSTFFGGNATTTASGAFNTNGLITAAAAGTGLSVINNVSVGGLATMANLLMTASTTLQNMTAVNSTTTNATTTNLYATNFFTANFSPANLSTGGTLTVSGQTSLGYVSTTGNASVAGSLFIGGFTTTTSGIVNTQTKYQVGGTDVLTSNTLGSGVLSSSLTSVGTLGALTVSGQTNLGNVSTTALSASGSLSVGGNATISSNGNISTNGTITSGLINGQTISSSANFTGSLTAAGLFTASNGLTLSSGSLTLPSASIADAALSSNVSLLNRSGQTFTGTNTFSATTTLGIASITQLSVSGSSTFSGNFVTPKGTDYSTTGISNNVNLGTGSLFRYTGSGVATFTGIAGGTDGRIVRIVNASAFNLTLTNQDSGSVSASQILTGISASSTVKPNATVTLQYDLTASRWRIANKAMEDISANAFVTGGNSFGATASLGTSDANALNFLTSGSVRFTVATTTATLTGTGATTITTDNTLGLSSAPGSALTVIAGTNGALTLDSGTTGVVNVGNGNNAKTINIGTGTAGNAINIGTNNTTADTISIGSALDAFSVTSTGFTVATNGALTGVASVDTISFTATGLTFAGAGTVSSTGANALSVDSGSTGGVNIGTGSNAKIITIGNIIGTTSVNINAGTSGSTYTTTNGVFSLNTGTGGINIGTDAVAKTITIGNITGATSLALNAGTGGIDIGANAIARTLNFGTGAGVVQTINIGGTGANVIGIGNTQTAGSLSIGAAMTGGTISIGGTGLQTGTFSIAPGTGAQTVAIANGSGVKTINIGGGASGNTINIATDNTVPDTLTVGSATDTMTIAAGTLNITNPAAQLNGSTVLCINSNRLRLGASASSCQSSSLRFKHDINDLELGIDAVNALRPVTYYYNDVGTFHDGLLAEDVYKVIPTAVVLDKDGMPFALDYNEITPVVIKALKEMSGLMGDISPAQSVSTTDNGLSTLIATMQTESPRDPVVVIGEKITAGERFITDFVSARVTAMRGYFDEVFAKKVHMEQVCLKKSDGSELCINGDQLQTIVEKGGVTQPSAPTPVVTEVPPTTDAPAAIEPPPEAVVAPVAEEPAISAEPVAIEVVAPEPTPPVVEEPVTPVQEVTLQ